MGKRSDIHSLRIALAAQELHRRAGGDIDKILPAMEEIIKEQSERRKKEEEKESDIDW